jgi:hypothetical protein
MEVEKRKPETPEQRAKRLRDRELNDLRVILSTPEGRRLIWRILSEARIFHDGYTHGDAGYGTTYNCGRRSIGVWTLAEVMEAKPEAFMQMQREYNSEAKREEIEIKHKLENKDILSTSD